MPSRAARHVTSEPAWKRTFFAERGVKEIPYIEVYRGAALIHAAPDRVERAEEALRSRRPRS